MKDNAWQLEWQRGSLSTATQTYLDLGLKPTSRAKSLPELRLRREIQGWLIAARSGHGHFAAYYERFWAWRNGFGLALRAETGAASPRLALHRQGITDCTYGACNKRQRQLGPDEVLGTPEGVTAFAKWAPATGLFHRALWKRRRR